MIAPSLARSRVAFGAFLVASGAACDPVSLGGDVPIDEITSGIGGSAGSGATVGPGTGGAGASGGATGSGAAGGMGVGGGASSVSTGGAGGIGGGGGSAGAGGAGGGCGAITVGTLAEVDAGVAKPRGIAIDATHIYWVGSDDWDGTSGKVMRADRATLTVQELASTALQPALPAEAFHRPESIAIDATHLVWSAACGSELHRLPLAGGAAQTLYDDAAVPSGSLFTSQPGTPWCAVPDFAENFPEIAPSRSLALDATHAYWLEGVNAGFDGYIGLLKAPLSGGAVQLLTPAYPPNTLPMDLYTGLVLDGSTLYYTRGSTPLPIPTTYQLDTGGQGFALAPLNGLRLATDATHLYGDLFRIPKGGGASEALDEAWKPPPSSALNDSVEWGDSIWLTAMPHFGTCGLVVRVPKDGSAATVLWEGEGYPIGIAVDGAAVHWTDIANGKVMVLTP